MSSTQNYRDISGMTRAERDAYFTALRGTGKGKKLVVAVSPALFEEIDHRKTCSRAAVVRRLLYYGLAEQKRLEVLGIKPGSRRQKERARILDLSAESEAARAAKKEPSHATPAAVIIGPAGRE